MEPKTANHITEGFGHLYDASHVLNQAVGEMDIVEQGDFLCELRDMVSELRTIERKYERCRLRAVPFAIEEAA